MSKPRRGLGLAFGILIIVLALVAGGLTLLIARWPNRLGPPPVLPSQGCMVTVDGFTTELTWEQSLYASIIVGESIRRGLPPRAATIALVTAYQESGSRNLDYGDRDSVGLFQQRPSQGWGSVEEIMDPWYSAGKFYEVLVTVPDWETGVINDVAQAVQRSGYPEAYAQHESKGRAWASALTGHSPAAVTCLDRNELPANAAHLTDFIAKVWGEAAPVSVDANVVTIAVPDAPTNWSITQLSMLRGVDAGLVSAQVAEQQWTTLGDEYALWQPATPIPGPVVLTLRPETVG